MRDLARWTAAAAVGAIAFNCVGAGVATAADFATPGAPPPQYYGEQQYYEPPVQEGYIVRPPAPVYGYPPPAYYGYGYGPPPVAVVPGPYYPPYYYGGGYRYRPYVARGYGPYRGGYRHYGRYR